MRWISLLTTYEIEVGLEVLAILRIEQDSYRYTHKILWPAGRWATAE